MQPPRLLLALSLLAASLSLAAADHIDTLPQVSQTLSGYADIDSIKRRLTSLPLHIIEGIWQFPADGATVVIERFNPDNTRDDGAARYRIVILRSPQRSMIPGTVMGYLSPSAKRGVYTAKIYTAGDGGSTLIRPKRFTLTLNDDGHLSFRRHRSSVYVNVWRLLPYVSRLGVRVRNDNPQDLDGCLRLFPAPVSGPVEPRYL